MGKSWPVFLSGFILPQDHWISFSSESLFQFAVGGCVTPTFTLGALASSFNLHAVHLEIVQTPWTIPLDEFNLLGTEGEWVRGEDEVIPLVTDGQLPRNGKVAIGCPAIWRSGLEGMDSWKWSPGKQRLSDDLHLRSSTFEG